MTSHPLAQADLRTAITSADASNDLGGGSSTRLLYTTRPVHTSQQMPEDLNPTNLR
jgi:hypothetical protein